MSAIEDAARAFYAPGSRLRVVVVVEREPYPAPEVTSRDPRPAGLSWPGVVVALSARAERAGWSAKLQYSRGSMPHARHARPGPVKHWYCVRMLSDDRSRAAYAIYDGKIWHSICVWGGGLPPFTDLGITELSQWISGVPDPLTWVQSIRERRAVQAECAKARAAERPRPTKSGEGL